MNDEKKLPPLTPEQIENWRKVLLGIVGPYALLATPEEIQHMRDVMQSRLGKS